MSQPTIWAVVPAAGIGTRFAADKPKQYHLLAGQPIAERSLKTLSACDLFTAIVVAVNPNDSHFSLLAAASLPLVEQVAGGASRAESVLKGLKALSGRAQKDDWVMVHDIARPLVTEESLLRLRDAATVNDKAIILAAPIYDTIKQAVNDGESHDLPVVEATLDRQQLWAAQTPQMVRYGLLYEALTSALSAGQTITDEASAVEYLGVDVGIVENTQQNIKITTAEDLRMAEFFLSSK